MAGFFKSRLFFVSIAIVIIASTLPLYVSGSLIAAFVVGYLETVTAYLISPAYRTIPALLLLVVVMYIRPQGLLGRR